MTNPEKKHLDPERAQARRDQVLNAAAICFARSGFHGASMAEISKAAGMSPGHIYNYFDGKDSIIAAFVERDVERIAEKLLRMGQQEDVVQAMLDNVESGVTENLDPKIWSIPLEISAEAARNPKIAALLQDADRRSRQHLRENLVKARLQRGIQTSDAELDGRVEAIIALFEGVSLRSLKHPDLDKKSLIAACHLALKPLLFDE
ncbi:TetR/AcrR family transcriptional regulator [Undibacterium terreum]|uniref:TetR family transcriptional regulator n=1 Tax=Undibacterium terreum TaxID=1224302 RepID=A0A916UFV3_9BURK|nr:TetR/AcrR family transcriptional regulator [Undibacterium terreum]GGC70894.1 TetR family transcriptional regulator [Undibacterium terreum]